MKTGKFTPDRTFTVSKGGIALRTPLSTGGFSGPSCFDPVDQISWLLDKDIETERFEIECRPIGVLEALRNLVLDSVQGVVRFADWLRGTLKSLGKYSR